MGIHGPAFGLLVSAVIQVAVLVLGLRKEGAHYTFLWNLDHPGLHVGIRLLVPNVLALSIAAMQNAYLLFAVPLTFVAQAIGQALLPQITTQATQYHYIRIRQTVLRIVGGAVLLSIPAAIVLLLKVLIGKYTILAIPLAASVTSTAQAPLLCIVLFIRLREKVKMDRGMQRLQQQRESAKRRRIQTEHLTPQPQKPEEETAT